MSEPITISKQSEYSKIVEGILEAISKVLSQLTSGENKIVDKIISGEDPLGEYRSLIMLIPGPDVIEHSGARMLLHRVTIHACYLSRDVNQPDSLKRQRNISGHGYDLLIADITLEGNVLKCVPKRVEPGFVRYGEEIYVGVLQTWEVWKTEGFTVP